VIELPDHLAPRVRRLTDHALGDGPVLYWMRTAVRADEHPGLDVAAAVSRATGRPMWVYHALSERYRFASDRHHRFVLEGARDVAEQLRARGLATAFHLERPGHRGAHLRTLAASSSLVVTEEMPVTPLREWTRSLADSVDTPVWAVDCATVVPMRQVGQPIERAFRYRQRIEPLLDRWLEPHEAVEPAASELPDLPFEPFDLSSDLASAIAACAIDHSVPPVSWAVGGPTEARRRWEAFRDDGLARYAATRNQPLRQGTSRQSPWLHYGMISPVTVAREARDLGGKGADTFVDELVVWRELAHTWCLYRRHHESLEALPDWARSTLVAHASDPRPFAPSLDQLHRGTTSVPLWDVAQRSLLRHGWLHNNVRMTWGKALLEWSPTPEEALRRLVDLNHRYALDGRDPASYGGLLWCLGQFDRPFPEAPVRGRVRGRSVASHARRLDVEAWRERIEVPRGQRVAVVGAGLAGAFAGRLLADQGVDVVLFDKGRGPGGRLSSRRRPGGRIRHGAPQLHIDDPRLERHLAGWAEEGLLRREGEVWVGDPPNAVLKHLLAGLDARFGTPVTALERAGERWVVQRGDEVDEGFDAVLVTVPAPQALGLLGDEALTDGLASVDYAPCWVTLVELDGEVPVADGRVVERVVEASGGWALHGSAAFSEVHLEEESSTVQATMCEAVGVQPSWAAAHRWRYARVRSPLEEEARYDAARGLGLGGDAFGGRANGALRSGMALAGRVLGASWGG
jgi:photolyase PhrII